MTRMCVLLGVALVGAAAFSVGADTVTVEPTRDATLYDSPDGSVANGAGQHAFIGRNSGGNTRRALLSFDVATVIPAGSTVTAVTLSLNVSAVSAAAGPASLHRVTTDWTEGPSLPAGSGGQGAPSEFGDATWLHASYPDTLWSTPGGDFDPATGSSTAIDQNGIAMFPSTPALAADVQAWLDDPASSLGWIIVGDESAPATARCFDSGEHPDPARRPALTISYVVPAPSAAITLLGPLAMVIPGRRRRRDGSCARSAADTTTGAGGATTQRTMNE